MKAEELKTKIRENSTTIGLVLELVLVIAAIFVAVTGSLKKVLSVYDKGRLKMLKQSGKADVKIEKLKNKNRVKAAKKELKKSRHAALSE